MNPAECTFSGWLGRRNRMIKALERVDFNIGDLLHVLLMMGP